MPPPDLVDTMALVAALSDGNPAPDRLAAATRLHAALEGAAGPGGLRALAEEVVLADGVLPILQLAQAVARDGATLAPLPLGRAPGNTPERLAAADAALLCCGQLCAAAASALAPAGWQVIPAPEDGRPTYLHRANVLRNSPPDIDWPGAPPGTPLSWAQQLLLDLPVLAEPLPAAEHTARGGAAGGQPRRGCGGWWRSWCTAPGVTRSWT
jgi:hypothetical protein